MGKAKFAFKLVVLVVLLFLAVQYFGAFSSFDCTAQYNEVGIGCCFSFQDSPLCLKYTKEVVEPPAEPPVEPPTEITILSEPDSSIIILPASNVSEENESSGNESIPVLCENESISVEFTTPAAHGKVMQETDSYSFYVAGQGCEGKVYEIGIYFDDELYSTILLPNEEIPEDGVKSFIMEATTTVGSHVIKVQVENVLADAVGLFSDSRRIVVG